MSYSAARRRNLSFWSASSLARPSILKDASVVVASYDIGDNMRGLIGVVGPTRMDYAAVAARLSYFAESLSKMFGRA